MGDRSKIGRRVLRAVFPGRVLPGWAALRDIPVSDPESLAGLIEAEDASYFVSDPPQAMFSRFWKGWGMTQYEARCRLGWRVLLVEWLRYWRDRVELTWEWRWYVDPGEPQWGRLSWREAWDVAEAIAAGARIAGRMWRRGELMRLEDMQS